ncbi:MAG: hypothetical protein IPJ04_15695 [Candidatus Eisenbacteria bacterium]|nr:hypothetical protein [Candidatus Eisenbacteria bacterium]
MNPSFGIVGDQAMVLDPEHGVLVITGGSRWDGACQAYVPSFASWKLPLTTLTWAALPALPVAGANDMQFLWDGARHRVLAVGGRYGFFCEADGQWYEGSSSEIHGLDPMAASPAWNLVTFRPDFRTSGAVVLDPDADALLSFGGFSPSRGIVSAENWNEVLAMPFGGPTALAWAVQSTGSPNSALGSDFAFDPRRGHVMVHGGLRALSAYGDYATTGAISAFDDPDTLWGVWATAHDAMEAAVAVGLRADRVAGAPRQPAGVVELDDRGLARDGCRVGAGHRHDAARAHAWFARVGGAAPACRGRHAWLPIPPRGPGPRSPPRARRPRATCSARCTTRRRT